MTIHTLPLLKCMRLVSVRPRRTCINIGVRIELSKKRFKKYNFKKWHRIKRNQLELKASKLLQEKNIIVSMKYRLKSNKIDFLKRIRCTKGITADKWF